MEKIMKSLIDNWTKGVDTYTHNGSTWLIFTDSKRWVIELTEDKTLWYNYNFFKQIFSLTSLDVVENQQYITKWVEDNVMNMVKDTRLEINITEGEVDDIIQDGVKETDYKSLLKRGSVEDTIENGVKETKISPTHTEYGDWLDGDERLDEIIKNGVKETNHVDVMKFFDNKMEDTLENGIRLTEYQIGDTFDEIDDIIENGVKFTFNTEYMPKSMVVDIIENGVKSSIPRQYVGENIIDKVIDKGVIETHREICEYKHTVEHIIQTGVKETHDDVYHHKGRIDGVIKNGVKKTSPLDPEFSVRFIDGDENNDWEKVPNINEVIDNGVKVSGTFVGGNRQKENIESVIGYGTKNPTD
jgi:tartrate dehydratase alpha subunit/fumarate hydratase class I-like protein